MMVRRYHEMYLLTLYNVHPFSFRENSVLTTKYIVELRKYCPTSGVTRLQLIPAFRPAPYPIWVKHR